MGRPKKIWRRKAGGHWYTTVGSKKVKVADASLKYRDAFDQFKLLDTEPVRSATSAKGLIDSFLDFCQTNRSEGTYIWYRSLLNSFAATLSDKLQVTKCEVYHLQEWLDEATTWNDNTKHCGARAVLRCFNWGVKQGRIRSNPFKDFEMPSRTPREVVIDDAQFAKMVKLVEPEFADYLTFLYETGTRPQEIKLFTADHWDGEKLTLERRNSKGKVDRRVIYTNEKATRIIRRLVRKYPEGELFRNPAGEPWKANTIRSRFRRRGRKGKFYGLSVKMGIPGLCATTLRHSFCTNALKRGVDTTTVAILMGHKDTSMVAKVYQHLAKDDDYMKKAVARATSGVCIAPLILPEVSGTFQVPVAGS